MSPPPIKNLEDTSAKQLVLQESISIKNTYNNTIQIITYQRIVFNKIFLILGYFRNIYYQDLDLETDRFLVNIIQNTIG